MTDIMFVTENDFSLDAREVIRELGDKPYVLLRVTVAGPYFPQRDSYPFVRIVGDERRAFESLMAEIASDHKELRGYFPIDVTLRGHVEFGYASHVVGRVPIRDAEPRRLDRARIPATATAITSSDLGPFRRQR